MKQNDTLYFINPYTTLYLYHVGGFGVKGQCPVASWIEIMPLDGSQNSISMLAAWKGRQMTRHEQVSWNITRKPKGHCRDEAEARMTISGRRQGSELDVPSGGWVWVTQLRKSLRLPCGIRVGWSGWFKDGKLPAYQLLPWGLSCSCETEHLGSARTDYFPLEIRRISIESCAREQRKCLGRG